ncbi:hypothetical protein ACKFKG_15765 [Phormidesmis sp. 146-35]
MKTLVDGEDAQPEKPIVIHSSLNAHSPASPIDDQACLVPGNRIQSMTVLDRLPFSSPWFYGSLKPLTFIASNL